MDRFRAMLLPLLFVPAFAAALTMRPYVAAQTTCAGCFFPNPVAVLVTDDAGNWAQGVAVTFSAPSNAFIPNAGPGPYTVLTDSGGAARVPWPGFVGQSAGTGTVVATSAAGEVRFDLTVAGGPPARMEVGSSPRIAMVNTAFEKRLIARVYGPDGQPLNNAAVAFSAPVEPGPSVVFAQGSNLTFAQASSFGEAYAPEMAANGYAGHGQVRATTFNGSAGSVGLDFWNSPASVASIEALPGSTPQSTRVHAFFPELVGAIVRDASGNPVANAPVLFSIPFTGFGGYAFFMADTGNSTNEFVAATGPDGRAVAPARLVASAAGPIDLTAQVPGPNPLRFGLTAIAGSPRRFEVVAGDSQTAVVNTTYPVAWTLRALGDDGLPVPYASVFFFADTAAGAPSGLFAGRNQLYVMADAQGVATAPPFTANAVAGRYFGWASGFTNPDGQYPFAYFNYENLLPALEARLLGVQPDNAPVGGTTWTVFSGLVLDNFGRPVSGTGYRWDVDPGCGRFLGQASFRGATDSLGRAPSPLLDAIAPTLRCAVTFTADNAPGTFGVTVHTFAPESLALTVPAELEVEVGSYVSFDMLSSADGIPVYYPVTASATTAKSGASAFIYFVDHMPGTSTATIMMQANGKPGKYEVVLRTGPVEARVPITQKQHVH